MTVVGPSDKVPPVPALTGRPEDTDILTVVDDFECVYDVPFVTVNRVEGQFQAEVILSGMPETDKDRIMTALTVGQQHGVRAYARVFGDYNNVLIYFTDEPAKGIIWALFDELNGQW